MYLRTHILCYLQFITVYLLIRVYIFAEKIPNVKSIYKTGLFCAQFYPEIKLLDIFSTQELYFAKTVD